MGLLHKEESGCEQGNKDENQKNKKLSWIKLLSVLVIGIVAGRFSVSGCNGE